MGKGLIITKIQWIGGNQIIYQFISFIINFNLIFISYPFHTIHFHTINFCRFKEINITLRIFLGYSLKIQIGTDSKLCQYPLFIYISKLRFPEIRTHQVSFPIDFNRRKFIGIQEFIMMFNHFFQSSLYNFLCLFGSSPVHPCQTTIIIPNQINSSIISIYDPEFKIGNQPLRITSSVIRPLRIRQNM